MIHPTGGSYTLSVAGQTATYRHDNVLLAVSDPATNWALQWANTTTEKET